MSQYIWRTCIKLPQGSLRTCLHQSRTRKLYDFKQLRWYSSYNTRPPFYHALKQNYGAKLAIVDSLGKHTYQDLLNYSSALAPFIIVDAQDHEGEKRKDQVTLDGERIAFMCPNNATYVITQWAIWMAGGMAVPLCEKHPPAEIEYVVEDSQSSLLISTAAHQQVIRPIAQKFNLKYLVLNENALSSNEHAEFEQESSSSSGLNRIPSILSSVDAETVGHGIMETDVLRTSWDDMKWKNRNAMLIYTSGTTGKPKGAVTTFGVYEAQVCIVCFTPVKK